MQAASILIRQGWQPGALGRITEMHALYGVRDWGREVMEQRFVRRLPAPAARP
jgi:hypothetical protein